MFSIPASIGWGPHWALNDAQAAQLTVALQDALETLPKGQREFVATIVGKYAPWAALAGVTYTLVAPRLMITKALYEQAQSEARRAGVAGASADTNGDGGTYSAEGFPQNGDSPAGFRHSNGQHVPFDLGELFNGAH